MIDSPVGGRSKNVVWCVLVKIFRLAAGFSKKLANSLISHGQCDEISSTIVDSSEIFIERSAECPFIAKKRGFEHENDYGDKMVKLLVRDKESIQEAVRRFRKLVERSGIKKEMRRREYYEKPSETKRRARLRAERRSKRARLMKTR